MHQVYDGDKIILLRPIELKSAHLEKKISNMSDVYDLTLDWLQQKCYSSNEKEQKGKCQQVVCFYSYKQGSEDKQNLS